MTEEAVLEQEAAKIMRWRVECLLGLGVSLADALLLADSSADLHQAAAMIAQGCPPELLARILL